MKSIRVSRILALPLVATLVLGLSVYSTAQTFTVLATLNSTTGEQPLSPLVQGVDGNLYGSAYFYGSYHSGTFFQVTPSGTATALYSFCFNGITGCPDGAFPSGTIALGTDGNFYGTTQGSFLGGAGNGTAYKITPQGSMTVLHTFCSLSGCADGDFPSLGLTLSRSGAFYGVTNAPDGSSIYYGVVFKITSSGTLTPLLTICPNTVCPTDAGPDGSLLLGSSGTLVAPGPGGANGFGAIYKMTPAGTPSIIYSFCDDSTCHDGANYVQSPVAQASNGAFVGVFTQGGSGANCTQTWAAVLHSEFRRLESLQNCTTFAAKPAAQTGTTPTP